MLQIGPDEDVSAAVTKIETLGRANSPGVRVDQVEQSRLIRITASAGSPQEAATSCNQIAEAFLDASEGNAQIIQPATPPLERSR